MIKRHSGIVVALAALWSATAQVWASEPSSVYMRCTISPAQYAKAMAAPPGSALAYSDWQNWFDGRKMYGSGKVDVQSLRDSGAQSLEELVKSWVGAGGLSHYDKKTGRWQFALLLFTENYGEMIQLLAQLRSVAPYCEAESDSFLIIYSYVWGNGDNAYITLNNQRSEFAAEPTSVQREESDAALKTLMDSYAH
ncbi:hypothetical protein [Pseudomonas viridiflava]|uniref:hypothetical protein n=1 Tax=Pseudomonas viridiflava TaxID=33069 RepID=UPI001FD001B9|nr:hypothetical protein [Pseudomonas viridiflava]